MLLLCLNNDKVLILYILCFVLQARGHCIAKLDPLNIFAADLDFSVPNELTLEGHNLSMSLSL